MLNGSSTPVWTALAGVDWLLTQIAMPVKEVEQRQSINTITLGIYSPSLG
jgi:hypothetical protein